MEASREFALQERVAGKIDPAVAASAEAAKARIQSAYVMALRKPRNSDEARDNILRACKRPAFAERVEYSKPVGGKAIVGPSIRFAETALREWGNVLTDTQVIYEDENVRRIKVFCTDLETNSSFSKEIQITKTVERSKAGPDREVVGERKNTKGATVYIVKATEDELFNKEGAAISKAIRNEGLRLIPSDIIDEALDIARATLKDRDSKDPDAAKKAVLDAFSEIGVKPRDVEQYLGHKTDAITPMELQALRGMYRAIRDGEAKWKDYIGGEKEQETTVNPELVKKFQEAFKDLDQPTLGKYLEVCAAHFKKSVDEIKAGAAEKPEDFKKAFTAWKAAQDKKAQVNGKKEEPPKQDLADICPEECPNMAGTQYNREHCSTTCKEYDGCPAWGKK